jgi:hypothetical protein
MPLCVAVFAPCGLLLPLFSPLSLIPFFCLPRICGATRLSLAGCLLLFFSISFSDLFHFSSPPPSGGCFRASSPIYVFFSIPWRFWPIFSMTSCINFSKWPAVSRRSLRCELRASRAAVLPSLLPNLPLRPPTFSPLTPSLCLPRRLQPCCRALQFYVSPMPALVVCFSPSVIRVYAQI